MVADDEALLAPTELLSEIEKSGSECLCGRVAGRAICRALAIKHSLILAIVQFKRGSTAASPPITQLPREQFRRKTLSERQHGLCFSRSSHMLTGHTRGIEINALHEAAQIGHDVHAAIVFVVLKPTVLKFDRRVHLPAE